MKRRQFILATLSPLLLGQMSWANASKLVVYKSPSCGCCSAWLEHMALSGFSVEGRNVSQETLWSLKSRSGVTSELSACHTSFIEGYFVEGHVPASDVQRLLDERPNALGLTVPGMPIGSPGMEMGNQHDAYETLLVMQNGATEVFAKHGGIEDS